LRPLDWMVEVHYCKKKGYLDQQSAVNVAAKCVCHGSAFLRLYYCEQCHRWHITKMRKEK
jgi:hypothetical protein